MTMAIIEPVVMPVDDASFSSASAPVARIGDVSFCGDGLAGGGEAVSYTHLTLPTILLV